MSRSRGFGSELRGVILYVCFMAFGCVVSLGLCALIYGLLLHRHPNDLYDSSSIFNPIFWVPSLFFGLMVSRFVRHRWMWLAPAAIGTSVMVGVMLWDISLFRHSAYELALARGHVWRYEFGRLFSPVSPFSPEKADRSLTQLFLTFPFLSSVAYSAGAWLAIRFGEREPLRVTTIAQ